MLTISAAAIRVEVRVVNLAGNNCRTISASIIFFVELQNDSFDLLAYYVEQNLFGFDKNS
jgi:hypothetical protein